MKACSSNLLFSQHISQATKCFSIRLLLISLCLLTYTSSLKEGETCSEGANDDCDGGLRCATCPINGNTRPRCSRIQPLNATSKVKGLPFNKYSWVTTHNSFALSNTKSATGSDILAPTNQEDTITNQLKNGVRGVMLDMYDFNNDIWLCHSFGGNCYNVSAFQPAINVLREIRVFMEESPSEIITIFIEDYVKSPRGLSRVFNSAGLTKYLFPLSKMPTNGTDWPTIDDMVAKNQRLILFTSKASKEQTDNIAYTWNFVVESKYGDPGMNSGSCSSRAESSAMDTKTRALVLQNYFHDNPNITEACEDNSASLTKAMKSCYESSGKRWPNFVAVDFYQRSDGGGVAEAVDEANGHLTCGCDNIAYCKENATFGTCDVPKISPPPPAALSPESPAQTNTSPISLNIKIHWFMVITLFVIHSLCV